MLIEALKPLRVHTRTATVELKPGRPVDLEEADALRLLAKAKGKVRLVSTEAGVIEPAVLNARPVYWERVDGIVGPARPLFLDRYGDTFLVIVEFEGHWTTIVSSFLRTKKEFESQVPLREVELIREVL